MTDLKGERDLAIGAIRILNDLLALDRLAISALMFTRHPCNVALAHHKSAQIMQASANPPEYLVGPLGMIQALFGIQPNGYGYIAAEVGDDGMIAYFMLVEPAETEAPHD